MERLLIKNIQLHKTDLVEYLCINYCYYFTFRSANFEISDEIPNFDNSEADADALVQYAMRKRREHRGGGPLFQPKRNDEPKAGFHVKVIGKPTTTSIVNDAGIPQCTLLCHLNKTD